MSAMPLDVLLMFLFCTGIAASKSIDAIFVEPSGALLLGPAGSKRSSKTVRRHSQTPDDDLPFVLDGPALSAGPFRPLPRTASSATAFDNSPFMLDDGTAPRAPSPGRIDSPFVMENLLGPKAETPIAAAEVQKQATEVNDSPFVLDTEQSQAPSSRLIRRESNHAPQIDTGSPFVVDQLAEDKTKTNADDDEEDQAHFAQLSKQVDKKNTLTIIRNSPPVGSPAHTTEMIRNRNGGETTTVGPPTNTEMQFELEGSLLETKANQRFVPVPGTPFELDLHVVSPSYRRPKVPIELQRLKKDSTIMSKAIPAVYPVAQTGATNQPGSTVAVVNPPQPPGNDATLASAPLATGQTVAKSSSQVAESSVPLSTQNSLNAPVVLPAPQTGPDSPKGNSSAAKATNTGNTSSGVGDAAASLGLNGTNSTLKGHIPAKAVTARGALIAIFLGFVVTVFFLSVVLCMLHAGRKPQEQSPREPPRPTRSYRQLLRAQQPEAVPSFASAATAPSV